MIRVLFFGQLIDQIGGASLLLTTESLPTESVLIVRDALSLLSELLPQETVELLRNESIMLSVNKQLATWDTELCEGDELAFMPPVSGG